MSKEQYNQEIVVKIDGDCMSPLINNADQVIVKMNYNENYKIGDIVLVKNQGRYKLHRVVKKSEKLIITKGDKSYMHDKTKNTVLIGLAIANRSNNIIIRYTFISKLIALFSNQAGTRYRKYLRKNFKFDFLVYNIFIKIVKWLKKIELRTCGDER